MTDTKRRSQAKVQNVRGCWQKRAHEGDGIPEPAPQEKPGRWSHARVLQSWPGEGGPSGAVVGVQRGAEWPFPDREVEV